MAGMVPVMRLSEYVRDYARHPEAKATDRDGRAAGPDTVGLLYRLPLESKRLIRIGKEVDRLSAEEGVTLRPDQPVEYERDDLADDIDYLSQFPQKEIAGEIGMSERRWRDIAKWRTKPRAATAERIARVASDRRSVAH